MPNLAPPPPSARRLARVAADALQMDAPRRVLDGSDFRALLKARTAMQSALGTLALLEDGAVDQTTAIAAIRQELRPHLRPVAVAGEAA